jgi:hypothetical protein
VPVSEANAALLHDHYKESFALIRENERQRDRLFLWLIALLIVLSLEVLYPANVHAVTGIATVVGVNINVAAIPLALLLDVSWIFYAAFVLKYCRLSRTVERQYAYLHMLEDRMSGFLSDETIYRREGRAYLSDYPILLTWAWIIYAFIFPIALSLVVLYLFGVEVKSLPYAWGSKTLDGVFVGVTIVTIIAYRFVPRRKRKGKQTYLDEVGDCIRSHLNVEAAENTSPQLLRLYAVLALVKGDQVTAEDVHDAWSAWTQEHEPDHDSLVPFAELPDDVKAADQPFVEAIKHCRQR